MSRYVALGAHIIVQLHASLSEDVAAGEILRITYPPNVHPPITWQIVQPAP